MLTETTLTSNCLNRDNCPLNSAYPRYVTEAILRLICLNCQEDGASIVTSQESVTQPSFVPLSGVSEGQSRESSGEQIQLPQRD